MEKSVTDQLNWSEDKLQAECVKWLWNTHPSTRRLFFHVPNQGARNKAEGVKLQAMGVVPGVPDCILIRPGGLAIGFEFKSAIGLVSTAQKVLHPIWIASGVQVHIIRTFEQFKEVIKKILKP